MNRRTSLIGYVLFQEMSDPSVQLRLHIKNPDDGSTNPVSFTVDSDKFRILLNGRLLQLFLSFPVNIV